MLVLEVLIDLLTELFNFSVTGWGIGLDCRDIEWFALETNRSFYHFEIATKYCILDSFVNYDGLPTVVDIMVI